MQCVCVRAKQMLFKKIWRNVQQRVVVEWNKNEYWIIAFSWALKRKVEKMSVLINLLPIWVTYCLCCVLYTQNQCFEKCLYLEWSLFGTCYGKRFISHLSSLSIDRFSYYLLAACYSFLSLNSFTWKIIITNNINVINKSK